MSFDVTQPCLVPCGEIAEYVDGELSPARETELEVHFAGCSVCADDLNLQKQLLQGLELGLKDNIDIDLPPDFAKVVVANAESTVAGLRRPRERFNALFICGGLGLFLLMSFGVGAAMSLIEQITAVGSFFGHIAYSFFFGVAVILRGAVAVVRPDLVNEALAAAFVAAAIVLLRRTTVGRLRS